MKFQIPREIKEVYKTLTNAGFEAYLVGGCVRDLLRNEKPKDWDITTNARPEEIAKLFPKTFYENKFGTISVVTESEEETLKTIEITPFRLEAKYTDKRHPDEIRFAKTLEEDLKRRDFTINAMALEFKFQILPQGGIPLRGTSTKFQTNSKLKIPNFKFHLVDLFKGQEDLKNKIIRAVGEPDERFNEDALRLLRAIRFATELSFEIEPETKKAIQKNARLLEMISQERIRDEFTKIIMSAEPDAGLELMRVLGVLKYVLPELEEGYGITQNKHHIYTVWEHDVRSMMYAVKKNWPFEIRLAALLHDVGKPRTKEGEGPDSTFYGHEIVGAKMVLQALNRLNYSKKFIDKVWRLVRYHLFYYNVGEVTESSVRRLVRRVGPEHMDDLIKVRIAERIGSGVPKAEPYKLRHFRFMVEKVQRQPISAQMLKINGNEVMRLCGIEPGPKVGFILNILLDNVLDDPSLNTSEWLENKILGLKELSETELKKIAESAKKKKIGLEEEKISEIKKKYWVK